MNRANGRASGAVGLLTCLLALAGCDAPALAPDAGPDAAPILDPFCDGRPRIGFCEDFDTAPLPGVFDRVDQEGASLAIDEGSASSPPASLRAIASGAGHARLVRTFDEGYKFRVFLFVRLDELDEGASGEAELLAIDVDTDDGPYRASLAVRSDGSWWAYERIGDQAARALPIELPLPLGEWMTARFDLELLGDGQASLQVRFGADEVLRQTDLTPPASTGTPTFSIGLGATGEAEWDVRYDNVTFEID